MLVKTDVKEVRFIQNPHHEKLKIRVMDQTARQRRMVEAVGGEVLRNYAIGEASREDMVKVLGALDALNAYEVQILEVINSLGS